MKFDILLAGVGGQGVLTMAALIGRAAVAEGLAVRQSEVHGMAQRGGAVSAHLRLTDTPSASDLIPRGSADMILSLEPVEALRGLEYLSTGGIVVSNANALVNVPDYPDEEDVRRRVRAAAPRARLVDAEGLARDAGDVQASNSVMVGAASRDLPLRVESLEAAVAATFRAKGERVVEVNRAAFRAGREAAT
jgi:indolepyruvate ferredoxin oxidoreductase beta subunit